MEAARRARSGSRRRSARQGAGRTGWGEVGPDPRRARDSKADLRSDQWTRGLDPEPEPPLGWTSGKRGGAGTGCPDCPSATHEAIRLVPAASIFDLPNLNRPDRMEERAMQRPIVRGFALATVIALMGAGLVSGADPDDGALPLDIADSGKEIHGPLDAQHGGTDGHLPPTQQNVSLVARMRINQDQEGRVADVGVLGNYAYVAAWAAPNCQKGGVYVFDISNPAQPKQINFIRTANDSYSGEGVQAVHLSTPAWTGDLLAFNNEDCTNNAGNTDKHSIGGASFIDVTNPKVHKYLPQGAGDRSDGPFGSAITDADAHEVHSVFVWEDENGTTTDSDDTAYAVTVDNEEQWDVDILDITNPRSPVLIAEYDLNALFPQIIQSDLGSGSSFLHDMVVKKIGGNYVMLLSYWDGRYVAMNVNDPTAPVYIADTDFTSPDPLLLERTGASLPPEGNGHQSEFSLNNDFVVAADEDFGPITPFISIGGGAQKPFSAGTATPPSLGAGDTLAGAPPVGGGGPGGGPAPRR